MGEVGGRVFWGEVAPALEGAARHGLGFGDCAGHHDAAAADAIVSDDFFQVQDVLAGQDLAFEHPI